MASITTRWAGRTSRTVARRFSGPNPPAHWSRSKRTPLPLAPLGVQSVAAIAGGFLASFLITPLARRAAVRWGVIDRPVGEKIHLVPTPLMGGVAVYLAFALAILATVPLTPPVVGVLAGGAAAVVVGLIDEVLTLPPLWHLTGQIAAAVVAVAAGIGYVTSVAVPVTSLTTPGLRVPAIVGLAFTIFWLVAMMNTMNFLDGLDGLATGVAAVAALLLAAWAWERQRFFIPAMAHHEDLILPLALAGALLGFLPFNWHRARIFLGDSGSMLLGLELGALSIVGPTKLGTALVVLLVPVLDVAWAIVRRSMRGRSFLSGDKQHVYHRMLHLGMSHAQTVIVLYGLCVALALLDLLLYRVLKLVAFLVLAATALVAFMLLDSRAESRARARQDLMGKPTP